jgi:hypothetical protein
MLAAILFENINIDGFRYTVNEGEQIPIIPPPMGSGDGQTSSMEIFSTQWITFWESPNFDEGDDSLWIEPAGIGRFWQIDNLHILGRPHGTNHWGDRIRAVSFSGPPTGSNENRTIIHADGTVTVGKQLLTAEDAKAKLGFVLRPVSLNSTLVPAGQ